MFFASSQQLLPGGERVGDRLLAPDVLAGLDRLAVELLVLLHVGQIDQQIERRAREHLVDVRIVVGDLELLGPVLRALGDDVARADELDVRATSSGAAGTSPRRCRSR